MAVAVHTFEGTPVGVALTSGPEAGGVFEVNGCKFAVESYTVNQEQGAFTTMNLRLLMMDYGKAPPPPNTVAQAAAEHAQKFEWIPKRKILA